MRTRRILPAILVVGALTWAGAAASGTSGLLGRALEAFEAGHTYSVPAAGTLEVGFSPNEGAEQLVVKVIDSARLEIKVLAYSFTSAPIVAALLRAKKRGVAVFVVADHKSNTSDDRSGKARAALSALANAGGEVRTSSAYAIHHDKVIIVDRQTVETGSFNFSASAASRNSENVMVNWYNPKLAEVYLAHFERNWRQASTFQPAY